MIMRINFVKHLLVFVCMKQLLINVCSIREFHLMFFSSVFVLNCFLKLDNNKINFIESLLIKIYVATS